jgi:hypothetical protein
MVRRTNKSRTKRPSQHLEGIALRSPRPAGLLIYVATIAGFWRRNSNLVTKTEQDLGGMPERFDGPMEYTNRTIQW